MKKITVLIFVFITGTMLFGCNNKNNQNKQQNNFTTDIVANSQRIVYNYTPQFQVPQEIKVSYNISQDRNTIVSIDKQIYSGINKENPLSISVSREPGSEYKMDIKILSLTGLILHKSDSIIKKSEKEICEINPQNITFQNPSEKYLSNFEIAEELLDKRMQNIKNPQTCLSKKIKNYTLIDIQNIKNNKFKITINIEVEKTKNSLRSKYSDNISGNTIKNIVFEMQFDYNSKTKTYSIKNIEWN